MGIDLTPSGPTSENTSGTVGCGNSNVRGTIRDFTDQHPDFENLEQKGRNFFLDQNMVATTLGADRKPVYVGDNDGVPGTASTSGAANFAQWFNSIEGVNQTIFIDLSFAVDPATGISSFDSGAAGFFPIDGILFGNGPFPPGTTQYTHNYHYTFELHTRFVYNGGEVFNFRGDDDVWVFINDQLVCDLGGVHGPLQCPMVQLDALGLTPGETYPLDFFYAERHVTESNFLLSTTLVFTECEVVE